MRTEEKTRYTAEELAEFKPLVEAKLAEARKDLALLKTVLEEESERESGSQSEGEVPLSKEEVRQLTARQEKYIGHLEDALVRLANGTYGVCRVTGKLIEKQRLRLVPHATLSLPAKADPQR